MEITLKQGMKLTATLIGGVIIGIAGTLGVQSWEAERQELMREQSCLRELAQGVPSAFRGKYYTPWEQLCQEEWQENDLFVATHAEPSMWNLTEYAWCPLAADLYEFGLLNSATEQVVEDSCR